MFPSSIPYGSYVIKKPDGIYLRVPLPGYHVKSAHPITSVVSHGGGGGSYTTHSHNPSGFVDTGAYSSGTMTSRTSSVPECGYKSASSEIPPRGVRFGRSTASHHSESTTAHHDKSSASYHSNSTVAHHGKVIGFKKHNGVLLPIYE